MARMARANPTLRKVVAFDLGTSAGWAVLDSTGAREDSGTEDCSRRSHEGPGMRPMRFRALVVRVIDEHRPALVAYELVRRHLGTEAAHVYGELRGVLREELERRNIPYATREVADMKRAATGKGSASKAQMVAAAYARWGHPLPVPGKPEAGDDEADALWCAEAARGELPADQS